MARAKNINVFVMDGVANGRIKVQISGRNVLVYKIPRQMMKECRDMDAFQNSGVYFLFGEKSVYVGQAEVRKTGKGIWQRIMDHTNDKLKDFWSEVVLLTTKDNSLGRTDISYLENSFYNRALEAGTYNVINASEPTIGTVTEEKESELFEFMDVAELFLGVLGYKVFVETKEKNAPVKVGLSSVQKDKTKKSNVKPSLPDRNLGPCAYAKTAFESLINSGYEFTPEQIKKYSTVEGSKDFTKRNLPMFWLLEEDQNRSDLEKTVRERFWKTVYTSSGYRFLMYSQWYNDNQKGATYSDFDCWYSEL